jgi:hypothetical protein
MASSLLGTGFFQPQARPGGVTVATERLAEEIAPFMQDYLERESALATLRSEGLRDEETGELILDPVTGEPVDPGGYKAYTGQTIADFTPEQLAAQRGLAGLAGFDIITDPETGERSVTQTGTGLAGTRFADAEALIRGQQEEFTGDVAQRFMSPFQQAVIDIEKREAQQKFEQDVLPKVQAAAIQSGSFGGSRGALLEAEALRGQQQLLGDIQSKGLQAAFSQGQKAFEAQKARERGQAQALMGLSPQETAQRTKELQGLERIGAAQQAQTQTALDEAYKQFLEEQAFPETVLDRMQSAAFGFPALRQTVTQRPTTFGPSPFQTLATNVGAIGTGIGNLFGQLGGKRAGRNQGGVVSRRDGGLVPLVRRQMSGDTSPSFEEMQEMGLNPIRIDETSSPSLEEFYENLGERRSKRERQARAIAARRQAQLKDRAKRAEALDQSARERFDRQNSPMMNLFRMLSQASNVKDPRGPQLAGIGREASVIAAERKAKENELATQAAARKEALLTAGEDSEIAAMERMLERGEKDTAQDIVILDKLATNAINALKNKTSVTANELKRLALYKNDGPTIDAITSQALQSQNIGGMFKEGKLYALDGKTPLQGEELGKAQKVMARAFRIYAKALKQVGGNQTAALSIAVSSFPDSNKTKKDSGGSGEGSGDSGGSNTNVKPKQKPGRTPPKGTTPRTPPKSTVDKTQPITN